AEKVPGILAILTHRNTPKLAFREEARGSVDPSAGRPLQPLQDEIVHYHGQPIAVVVADTLEHATQAAALVRVAYREERAVTDFATAAASAFPPSEAKKSGDYLRGEPDKAFAAAEVRLEHTYVIAAEHHNPMEPHAT